MGWSWGYGATFQTYTATYTGKYSVQISNASNCTGSSTQIQVTKNALPTITLTTSGPTTFCNGDSVVISSTTNAVSPAFQWLKNSALINGATNPVYTAKTAGKYQVQITNTATGCSKTSSKVSVSINCKNYETVLNTNVFSVFPNPTEGYFTLSFSSDYNSKGSIEIYNALGQMIYNNSIDIVNGDNVIDLDLQNSPTGIYFLNLKTDGEVYREKLVKD